MSKIHPTAIIDPRAEIGSDVEIGPHVIIEGEVKIGDRCRISAGACITGFTRLGKDNQVHMGAILGHIPQDRAFASETRSYLEIGDNNIFREYCTVHRATRAEQKTVIGNSGFFMAHSHIAHDCKVGNDVIVCNNSSAAGYVELGDRAFVSGNVVIHQFSRIGSLCMLGGGCQVGQDVPPYTTVAGRSQIRALNVVGMRRAGIGPEVRQAIKTLYRRIFAETSRFADITRLLNDAPDVPEIHRIRDFYAAPSKRGFCRPPANRSDLDDERERAAQAMKE